jgi:hypothetical protein
LIETKEEDGPKPNAGEGSDATTDVSDAFLKNIFRTFHPTSTLTFLHAFRIMPRKMVSRQDQLHGLDSTKRRGKHCTIS